MEFQIAMAASGLNSELQIVVGSAGPQQRAPDCSGQCRASPGEFWSGGQRRTSPGELLSRVGSAGPQLPEDISKDMSEICQARMSENMSENMSIEISDNMPEKNVRNNFRKYVRKK